jgi:hypothetical protein
MHLASTYCKEDFVHLQLCLAFVGDEWLKISWHTGVLLLPVITARSAYTVLGVVMVMTRSV